MFMRAGIALVATLASGCRPPVPAAAEVLASGSSSRYEQDRIMGMGPGESCSSFKPKQGITVTKRDGGKAVEGKIRVLVDNPSAQVVVIGDFNDWGNAATAEDMLQPSDGPYYEGKLRKLWHGMQYRLKVNGTAVLDPAATLFTTESYLKEQGLPAHPPYLNSVFWDFERPDAYKMQTTSVDLRRDAAIIAEAEVLELVRKWPRSGGVGPVQLHDTYRFIAEGGVIDELKNQGYNAVEFLPFNTSMDGEHWHYRYQVYGLFAPDSRYGNPDEFARMMDAFNKAGIAVIMDAVVGHFPYKGNDGVRALGDVGIHKWKKKDGGNLYGQVPSPWGTYRYDYANPYVRDFLTDSIVHMTCRYGMSGIRFDNLDGIRLYEGPGGGGPEFLKELVGELRRYRPEMLLIAEMFFGHAAVLERHDQGGFGINFRTHSDFFDFIKDNMLKGTGEIGMGRVKDAIRGPFEWGESPRVQYVTNHDEAANRRDGATGKYVATLLNGGGWYYVEKKTMAFASLAMLSTSAYLDMPQLRLLQEGSFNDNSAIDWELRKHDSQKQVYAYFAAVSKLMRGDRAFAFANFRADTENHVDEGGKVISLMRRDSQTGRRYYVLINLSHVGYSNYRFGVDYEGDLKVVIDSDAKQFGGSGELAQRLPDGLLRAGGPGGHGKSSSVSVPYLAPYGTVILRNP
jgi:1,4-alpha-glucan branching enzyme